VKETTKIFDGKCEMLEGGKTHRYGW